MKQTQWWFASVDPDVEAPLISSPGGVGPAEIRIHLAAGDALFIPVGWWHALEAQNVSATLSFIDFGVPNDYPTPVNVRR